MEHKPEYLVEWFTPYTDRGSYLYLMNNWKLRKKINPQSLESISASLCEHRKYVGTKIGWKIFKIKIAERLQILGETLRN